MMLLLFLLACSTPAPPPAVPAPPPPVLGSFVASDAPDRCDCVLERGPEEPVHGVVAFVPTSLQRVTVQWRGTALRLEGPPKTDGDDVVVRLHGEMIGGTEVDGLLRATLGDRRPDAAEDPASTFDGSLTVMDADDTITTSFHATCGC